KEVTYIGENKTELSLTDPYVPKLGVTFKKPDPTFTSGKWTSSNDKIATIATVDGKGQVTLAGQELGKVKFTFTADDGALEGVTDSDKSHIKTGTSQEYNVTAGGEAGIVVPKGGDSIIALENSKAQVRWYGNMKQYLKPADPAIPYTVDYTVEVFEGNLTTEADFKDKEAVHTSELLSMDKNSYEIPENILTTLSVGTVPAYTVRISTPHPNEAVAANHIKLYAYAYIIVNPVPVTVKLTPPAERYVLDSGATSSVTWDIGNYKGGTTTATLTVERVTEAGATDLVLTEAITAASGTRPFNLAKVEGDRALRDLYVVTVKAQNPSDGTVWNSDSYQFYVYKNGALDIVVGADKRPDDSVTLSNRENELVTVLPTATDKIMELRGLLGLNTPIGINYAAYAWSALKDGIRWTSADDTKVGLNFKQGSFYEDIKRFNYDRYLPATTMAISGTGETESTVITATHANTGMATSIDVKVESLQNRLYIFQATPMLETALTYTDGKGTEKTVKTNAQGTLALYEPDGIRGAVYLRATDGADLYLGTISAEILRSGEGNTLVQELYPLNSITLRK
ncbi:MAG: cell wall anchor protein, partial [Oscillospiraceae bacterium]